MAQITIQILEGMERGKAFEDVSTPVTIGREDDNHIRLNDERVSRFHAKIQHDGEYAILTDLDSTNGTRVNGHPVQIHVLQPGDVLWIGRCVLVYGSRDEIAAAHFADCLDANRSDGTIAASVDDSSGDRSHGSHEECGELFPNGPPRIPSGLALSQQAQLADLLAFIHDELRRYMEAGQELFQSNPDNDDSAEREMQMPWCAWQELVGLELNIAQYLRQVADPES